MYSIKIIDIRYIFFEIFGFKVVILIKKNTTKVRFFFLKLIIFGVLEVDRGSSQFFMTDSFFQSRNTHSGQISCF
jgi:hypothetical protein